MDRSRWCRIEQVFNFAIDLGPDRRRALLDTECGADLELRNEVEHLLQASDEAPNGFLDRAKFFSPTFI